jgi:hypothetical protein
MADAPVAPFWTARRLVIRLRTSQIDEASCVPEFTTTWHSTVPSTGGVGRHGK